MPVALEEFVKQLEDSGVISSGKLQAFIPPQASPKSAEDLAKELVKQKHLTKFQAQEIYQGRAKSLILGNYTIIDKIGAGGMGQVFKAQHRRMERVVAIKMLPAAMLKDAAAVARFEREVVAAARLSHPNIVTAHDADEANGVHFLVMEYVEAADLSALVKKDGPLAVAKAVNYILQAARGLEYAHKHGVIHRDIKPANLLLNSEGTVKILDMGLARLSTDGDAPTQAELTGTGAVMGTVDYMAPEQALSAKHANARADIYSLGCSLHYLLTGKAAYNGDTLLAKLLAHREQPIPSLGTSVPAQVQAVFEKMVAKNVEDRYQTMREVVAALEQCNAGPLTSLDGQQPAGKSSSSDAMTFLRNVTLNTVDKPKQTKKSQPSAANKGGRKNRILIGAGSAAAIVALLAVILVIANRNAVPKPSKVAVQLVAESGPPEPAIAPFDAQQARSHQEAWAKYLGTQVETTNSIGMKMILLPPGEFLMGSTDEQVESAIKTAIERGDEQWAQDRIRSAERPQHKVVLTKPLAMSAREVTVGQFRQFVEATKYATLADTFGGDSESTDANNPGNKDRTWRAPGYAVTDDSPVTQVSWMDAVAFCNWLCQQEKLQPSYRQDPRDGFVLLPGATGYRLPTDAQREYACRAGTTTQYSFGDDPAELPEYGWYGQNSGGSAVAVGLKPANPFGLFDMHGNAEEWCADWVDDNWYAASPSSDPKGPPTHYPSGEHRVVRGGKWSFGASPSRSAFRIPGPPVARNGGLGFRVVRSLEARRPTTAQGEVAPITTDSQGQWISLFNGKDLTGWKANVNPGQWKVDDGCIVASGVFSHLFYVGGDPSHLPAFKNFHLKAELMTLPHSNSGIYFHAKWDDSDFPKNGYEFQVNNSHADPVKTGSLYNVEKRFDAPAADNEWFTAEIIVNDKRIVTKVNGTTIVDYKEPDDVGRPFPKLDEGTFALQAHDAGSTTKYRKIEVQRLP